MRGLISFFAYIANSMIAPVAAAAYDVLLLLRVQMIAIPGKTRNSDISNQNQSYGIQYGLPIP